MILHSKQTSPETFDRRRRAALMSHSHELTRQSPFYPKVPSKGLFTPTWILVLFCLHLSILILWYVFEQRRGLFFKSCLSLTASTNSPIIRFVRRQSYDDVSDAVKSQK